MKDAKGHGSETHGGAGAANHPMDMKKTLQVNAGAHSAGVQQVGTKPMLPPESSQSRDLRLFADSDKNLSRQSLQPVRDNLGKKMDKGVYDPDKATKLWGYHADRAAQSYAKQGGSTGENSAPWHQQFSPAVRREAAANWERDEAPDIKSGSSRTAK